MISITAKWLSGDVVTIDVPSGSRVAGVLPLLTDQRAVLMEEDRTLPSDHAFTRDTSVCLLAQDPPSVAFVFGENYINLYRPYEIKKFCHEEVSRFDTIITDYYTDTDLLGITPTSAPVISYQELIEYCDLIFRHEPGLFMDEGIRLRWREYKSMVAFSFMLPTEIQQLLFPIDDHTKRHAKLTPSEWFSWFAVKR
jgi:hypothetical protein